MTTHNPRVRDKPEEIPSPEKLINEVLWRTITHPLTTGPLAVGFMLTAYSIALAPFFGGFLIAFPLGMTAGVVGLANGVARFFKGRSECEERLAKLIEEKIARDREVERRETEEKIALLRDGFREAARRKRSFEAGQVAQAAWDELDDLVRVFKAVGQEINQSQGDDKFALDITVRIEPLTKKIFQEGLNLLFNTLDLLNATTAEDEKRLHDEIGRLEQATTNPAGKDQEVLKMQRRSLASKRDQLGKIQKNRILIDTLICRVDECENNLRTALDDLKRIRTEWSEDALEELSTRLQDCLKFALEVRKQLKLEGGLNV